MTAADLLAPGGVLSVVASDAADPAQVRTWARGQAEAVRRSVAAGLLDGAPVLRSAASPDPERQAAERLGVLDDTLAAAESDLVAACVAERRAAEEALRAAKLATTRRAVLARLHRAALEQAALAGLSAVSTPLREDAARRCP